MQRFVKLSLLGLAAGMSACSTPDLVHPTEVLPYAGVRFINAVPDSAGAFGLDFRFIDLLESNAHFRITFRNAPNTANAPTTEVSTAIQYKGAREGHRLFRVFLDDTLQSAASTTLVDAAMDIVKGHNYTAMLWGYGRRAATVAEAGSGGDRMAFAFWEEDVTAPAAGKVKLRVVNATNGALDVWAFPTGGTIPAQATWPAVPAYSRSTYVEVDSGSYTYRVRTAGSGTNLFSDRTALLGSVPSCSGSACQTGEFPDFEAAPGTRAAGSAISGFVFPATITPSPAALFANPGITFAWDKRPPRICDPYC
jgi:hypothetical protein